MDVDSDINSNVVQNPVKMEESEKESVQGSGDGGSKEVNEVLSPLTASNAGLSSSPHKNGSDENMECGLETSSFADDDSLLSIDNGCPDGADKADETPSASSEMAATPCESGELISVPETEMPIAEEGNETSNVDNRMVNGEDAVPNGESEMPSLDNEMSLLSEDDLLGSPPPGLVKGTNNK